MPTHPAADMHGFLRAVIRCNNLPHARTILSRYGVSLAAYYFGPSLSQVEQQITATHFGEVFGCQLSEQYVSPAGYQLFGPVEQYLKPKEPERKGPAVSPLKAREFE